MFCTLRKLFIKPGQDCPCCVYPECEHHPEHASWPTIKSLLKRCKTQFKRKPKTGHKPWDGTKENCRRWRWYKGCRPDEDACFKCTIDRPCEHRGEDGENMLKCWRDKDTRGE